jgi:hypothetical protein
VCSAVPPGHAVARASSALAFSFSLTPQTIQLRAASNLRAAMAAVRYCEAVLRKRLLHGGAQRRRVTLVGGSLQRLGAGGFDCSHLVTTSSAKQSPAQRLPPARKIIVATPSFCSRPFVVTISPHLSTAAPRGRGWGALLPVLHGHTRGKSGTGSGL